ncbi:hypothetical protein FKM82_021972 [Ascaphus truei]
MANHKLLPVGLINAAGRYLTGEAHQFHVNAQGTSLRPRQIWTLEFVNEDPPQVQLRSSLLRYLATDTSGKITCNQESPGSGSLFCMLQQNDGRVSFMSDQTKRFLGGAEDNVTCFAQAITETEKWTLHLSRHPCVNMQSLGKRRYLRYDEKSASVCCDRDLPWKPECVMTLYFDSKEKKYGIRAINNHLVASDGKLDADPSPRCLYNLELVKGMLALRDADGKYLTGRESLVKTFKTDKPGRDELFMLEHSPGQVAIRALSNGKYVCCRPGADIYANRTEIGDTETLQILLTSPPCKACFRSINNSYLTCGPRDVIISGTAQDDQSWFELQYNGEKASFLAGDGRYITVKPNGQLALGPNTAGPAEQFVLLLVNRPLLILQSDFGFVAFAPGTDRLDGNRPFYNASKLSTDDSGFCQLKEASTDKYWALDKEDRVTATGENPINFTLEFTGSATLILRAPNGKYMVAEQGGSFKARGTNAGAATHFRY